MVRLESVREVAEELVTCMFVAAQREKSGLQSHGPTGGWVFKKEA